MRKDEKIRCSWVDLKNSNYIKYHDCEWGKIKHNDKELFECLILEIFQAGLSFEIVLNKRENFKKVFNNFDYKKIALYDDNKIKDLMQNNGIIRNIKKIKATINNAKIFLKIQKEYGSFNNYIWGFTKNNVVVEFGLTHSKLSDLISYDLKNKGMQFLGTKTIYSYLCAIGIINSHDKNCFLNIINNK